MVARTAKVFFRLGFHPLQESLFPPFLNTQKNPLYRIAEFHALAPIAILAPKDMGSCQGVLSDRSCHLPPEVDILGMTDNNE